MKIELKKYEQLGRKACLLATQKNKHDLIMLKSKALINAEDVNDVNAAKVAFRNGYQSAAKNSHARLLNSF